MKVERKKRQLMSKEKPTWCTTYS